MRVSTETLATSLCIWGFTDNSVSPFRDLSILDKLLAPLIVIAMIVGVVIGESLVVWHARACGFLTLRRQIRRWGA